MSRSQVSVSGLGITAGAVLCVLLGGMAGATLGRGDDATVVYSPPTTTTVTSTLTERVAIFTDNTAVQTVTVTVEPTGSPR